MVKKKRIKDPIIIDKKIKIPTEVPNKFPECYGNKDEYCREELCGEWFESCKKH